MDELIRTFHIDWKLLIAQLVNFAVVLWVLYRFAIKPLSKAMDKRSKEIAKSLEDAKKIETNLMMAEEEREKKIQAAKQEAHQIIEQAQAQGSRQAQEMLEQAKADVGRVVTEAKNQIKSEKETMLREVKTEVAELVVKSTRKILAETVDNKIDSKLIEQTLIEIKNKES
ncbi:MAG TPA: F0F1 ATP synthase subunit B [Patescibacteria group bacterium]|nr:F0F1 ATP synthase subunit B [Patescibacteria group bacterium]